uniref:Uncharacterized protein n=1 Tax=Cacopsylla melanoneura TaxID=428564 RepID=A0A8D8PMQ5_9HEMI
MGSNPSRDRFFIWLNVCFQCISDIEMGVLPSKRWHTPNQLLTLTSLRVTRFLFTSLWKEKYENIISFVVIENKILISYKNMYVETLRNAHTYHRFKNVRNTCNHKLAPF